MNEVAKIKVTVVVPVKNEAATLGLCLERLDRFDEVIVVDSASTDGTRDIARAAGAVVIDFVWDGKYPKKRNWVLKNYPIRNEWVFFLDADELVDDAFCDELAVATRRDDVSAFWIRYQNWFMGRCLRHGVPQRKIALFRVGKGLYERIDEDRWTSFDMEVHEHPIIDGPIGEIRAYVMHKDDRGIVHWIDRHRSYAAWEVERLRLLMEGPGQKKLTRRQRFKYRHLRRGWFPFFYFFLTYVVRGGFLDGYAGLQHALYKFWYFNTIGVLAAETDRRPR